MASPQEGLSGGRPLLFHTLASLIDQALLSALNLALGLVLIRLATKTTYGIYSQIFVAGIFAATLLDALITGPMTTLAPGRTPAQRHSMVAFLYRFQLRASALMALVFGAGAAVLAALFAPEVDPLWLGLGFAVYVFAGALREYRRSVGFIEGQSPQVLLMDLGYAVAAALGAALLAWRGWLDVPAIFMVLGAANLVALLKPARWMHNRPEAGAEADSLAPADERVAYRAAVGAIWQRGRWAMPGALVAWATNYGYLYISAAALGAAAAADLNASRLLLMPIALSVTAWSRVVRPVASRLFAAHHWHALDKLTWASVAGIELLTMLYVALLWWALPWLEQHVLGAKYAGMEPLILAWGGYFAVNAARWIGSSWLTSNDSYAILLISGVVSLVIMLVATAVLLPLYGIWGAILALVVVETVDLVLIWGWMLPLTRRHARSQKAAVSDPAAQS